MDVNSELNVKSFRKLESDMTARIEAPKLDQNGEYCAIIKVVTDQTGFVWESDGLGIVAAEPKIGEYWLYVPFGAKRLTVKHAQLGILRDYMYTLPIEKSTVYELVLSSGKVIVTVQDEIASQFLYIRTEPANALIYINDRFETTGEFQRKLKPGKYTYRIEAPLYHNQAGVIHLTESKEELNVVLKPAFGYLEVSSTPESSARVLIDGKEQTTTTPLKSEPLASGDYTVQVIKDMYQPATQKVTVQDGKTTPIEFTLLPNFAELSVSSATDANIFVNNQKMGTGNWHDRLSPGVYSIEVQREKHKPALQDVELVAGEKRTLMLQPTPICGSLDVLSSPGGATIAIDGKNFGTTPNSIGKLLIGNYTIILSKPGYATVTKSVSIVEGKTVELNETLTNGRTVNITSMPVGVNLSIDGVAVGQTPYIGTLTYGSHILKIEQGMKVAEKTIVVSQTGGETSYFLQFGLGTVTDIDGNVYHTINIGNQIWMVENLKTTRYRDGTSIPNKTDASSWSSGTTGAYCDFSNNPINSKTYGLLYNWYAVNSSHNIAPTGWHVPTDAEWTMLINYLGGGSIAGGKLKEVGTALWSSPNTGASNEWGFSALPGGCRSSNGTFSLIGNEGNWWSASQISATNAWGRYMSYDYSFVGRNNSTKSYGFSVRCVKD
jgi:uncharacterized protein (TIGR02145 family)